MSKNGTFKKLWRSFFLTIICRQSRVTWFLFSRSRAKTATAVGLSHKTNERLILNVWTKPRVYVLTLSAVTLTIVVLFLSCLLYPRCPRLRLVKYTYIYHLLLQIQFMSDRRFIVALKLCINRVICFKCHQVNWSLMFYDLPTTCQLKATHATIYFAKKRFAKATDMSRDMSRDIRFRHRGNKWFYGSCSSLSHESPARAQCV